VKVILTLVWPVSFGQNHICQLPANQLAEFRNRELGFVWQIHSLLAAFTALENVMMPLLIRGQSQEEAEPVSMALLEESAYVIAPPTARANSPAVNNNEWFWRAPFRES
jgi:ABC-type transporter Mla maintaining outer membrane lipid asymmetry ATPase subunit MlaF